jgi:hypothetical protein
MSAENDFSVLFASPAPALFEVEGVEDIKTLAYLLL